MFASENVSQLDMQNYIQFSFIIQGGGGVNHFIPYLAMRHRMVTKLNKLLWLTVHSIIMGGGAPSSNKPSSVSDQPYTI